MAAENVRIIPLSLKDANRFVDQHHRHNKGTQGHKFSLGLLEAEELIGVAIMGRPVSRVLDNGKNVEILRVCVKPGHPNVCSKLYARAGRICQLMGYEKIITYTLKKESQSSLKAIGAVRETSVPAQEWNRPGRRRKSQPVYTEPKIRWDLNKKGSAPLNWILHGSSHSTKDMPRCKAGKLLS